MYIPVILNGASYMCFENVSKRNSSYLLHLIKNLNVLYEKGLNFMLNIFYGKRTCINYGLNLFSSVVLAT